LSTLLTILHVLICVILILAVLLQSGKSADLAGAFGGGGTQTVFGPRGAATLLSRVTTISAVLFMVTSFGLWIISAKGDRSVFRGEEAPIEETVTQTQQPEEATENNEQNGQKQDDKKPDKE